MKKLFVVLFIVLASPLLVKVNINQPTKTSAVVYAGRTFDGGGYCDPCISPPGTCAPNSADSPCLNGATAPAPDALNAGTSTGTITLLALTIWILMYGLRP